MATTYDPTLPTDRDWVRFLIGDRSTTFSLQDEEIAAVLVEESNKYYAAARCASVIQGLGGGAVRKRVGSLMLEFSDSADNAYQRLIDDLRRKGADENMPGPAKALFVL